MADDDFGFAPPPFKPADTLVQLKRSLRDLRVLTERGAGFEWKGLPAVTVSLDAAASADACAIAVQRARKPSRNPTWDSRRLTSAAEVRHWLDETRRVMARWDDDD